MTSTARVIQIDSATGQEYQQSQTETLSRAGNLAATLHNQGLVNVGDRVALLAHNSVGFLEVSIAVASAGGCPVPINWHWTPSEVAHVLADAAVSLIFCDHALSYTATRAAQIAGREVTVVVIGGEGGDDHTRADPGFRSLCVESLIEAASAPLEHVEGALAASLGMIYTSGTTGRPKGVARELMTPHQILEVAGSTAQRMGIRDGGTVLVPGPLYHTSPNAIAVLALRMGATLILMDGFDAELFLELTERYRVEHAKVVPTMLSRLLTLDPGVRDRYDISSLTHLVHSAAPCPPAIKRAAIEWFGSALIEFYGCSEVGTVCWISADEWLTHPGSVGRPVDGADIKIVTDTGEPAQSGSEGHVQVRGADYWPRFRYLNRDNELQPEYVDVGDRGFVDEDGFLYLTGRSSDIVIIGGTNVYLAEIEAAAMAYSSVEDAGAVGVATSSDLGEEITLYVVPRPDADLKPSALAAHLAEHLASVKIPRRIIVRESLPRDDNGKLYRRQLLS